MKQEELNVEQMENEISIIEQNHQTAILSIHENMQQLVYDCNAIIVIEDDKESYDKAVELKRKVKSTHVSIEKKRKELKQPLIDYGKRLDKWVETIYTPLVQAEKIVKSKMDVYEANQEKLKEQRKLIEEQEKEQQAELDVKLIQLNSQLGRINSAKSKIELKEIETYLDSIVLADFGNKSGEAGFILNQLKLTCSMASRLMKDDDEIFVETPKIEATPITDDLVDKLKDNPNDFVKKIIVEEPSVADNMILDSFEDLQVEDDKALYIELKKPTDDDVIDLIDVISNNTFPYVIELINDCTLTYLNNKTAFEKMDLFEHHNLIYSQIKKRLGVLLSK